MVINLWKLATGKTSYNPLPLGYVNSFNTSGMDYVLKFKARSNSSATLYIYTNSATITQNIVLTPDSKEYNYSFYGAHGTAFRFRDLNDKGDIIVEDIQLVQKPLPTLTINGISENVSDWVQGSVSGNGTDSAFTNQSIRSLYIPVNPNTAYTLNTLFECYVHQYDTSKVGISSILGWGGGARSFTTANNATFIRVLARRSASTVIEIADVVNHKLIFNLGITPAPYEKKRGERMVLPTVKKNLFSFSSSLKGVGANNGAWHNPVNGVNLLGNITLGYPVDLQKDKPYTISGKLVEGEDYQLLNATASIILSSTNKTIIPVKDETFYLRVKVGVGLAFQLENFQLEQGTTATPYEPYAVQVNKKPKRYVPKKNLFDGMLELGTILTSDGTNTAGGGNKVRTPNKLAFKPSTSYVISTTGGYKVGYVYYYGVSGNFISYDNTISTTKFTTPSNCYQVRFIIQNATDTIITVSEFANVQLQLEEGSTSTSYEPYQLVLPQAKSGLRFEDSYVQLPSMTMDSIEIDCLIDSNSQSGNILDARVGLANAWLTDLNQYGSGISSTSGAIKGVRTKIKVNFSTVFTDDIIIFSDYSGTIIKRIKATLYGITCYLNGNIVAQYDAQSIVGDKLLQGVKQNLIPSFEDSRWSLHANADVLGKDVLRLEASGSSQASSLVVDVKSNTNYYTFCDGLYIITDLLAANVFGSGWTYAKGAKTFNSGNNTQLKMWLSNSSTTSGTFEFIKPQLYQLDGKEGTLVGKPTPLRKQSKRTLYSKR
jgi:hypothetical protein